MKLIAAALTVALLACAYPSARADQVATKDWDVYVDLPTRFAFIKTPTGWKFIRQLDEEQMQHLPPTTLTALLAPDEDEIHYAHPALEPSPRVQALRAATQHLASNAPAKTKN